MKTHSTYHADCLCGKPITSETRITKCEDCQRVLVFEWGGGTAMMFDAPKKAEDEKPKAKGASA
jgi:hypothetical protein